MSDELSELREPQVTSDRAHIPSVSKKETVPKAGSPFENILRLQRTAGNQAVQRFMQSRLVQAKLAVSQPCDPYEVEADRVADAAVEGAHSAAATKDKLQGVNLKIGSQATMVARAFNARAVTVGKDIYFGQGQYAPHALSGKKLIAHELAHTVQQANGARMIQRQATDEEKKPGLSQPHKPLDLNLPKYPKEETLNEKVQRIIKEKPPEPPKKRTAAQLTKSFVLEKVGDILRALKVPHKWHSTIEDAAYSAVVSGAESLLDKAMDGAGLDSKGKLAVKKALEAGAKTPLF